MKRTHIPIPKPNSKFNKIICNECGEQQVVYSHVTTAITCNSCGNVLAKSTGSLAKINGRISGSAE